MSNKTQRVINTTTHDYAYDDLYRLSSFGYDEVGNRTDTGYSLGSTDSDTERMNEYASTPDITAISYDDNGNTTSLGSTDLTYDYKNQLISYDGNASYQYDALGRRIAKTVGDIKTEYYCFGDRVLDEWEYDDEGYEIEYRSFVYGNYIDEVVQLGLDFDLNGGIDERYYYHSDDLFNVMALSNGSGGIAESYDYDEFCKPTTTSSLGNPFLFNGRQYDAESSLYYYRTRYLNPEIGRFISRDTIGIWGDPSNLGNGYTYVANNPWTYVDPFGEDGGLTIAGGATITAIVAYPVDVGSQALANAIYGRPLGEGVVGPLTFLGQGVSYVDGLIRRSPTYDPVKNKVSEVTFNRLDNTTANLDHGVANAQVGLFNEGVNNHPLNNLNTFSASFGDHVANELHWAAAVGAIEIVGRLGKGFNLRLGNNTVSIFADTEFNSFNSFSAFKRKYGSAGDGLQWHHIVEQYSDNISRFGPEAIHNTDNIIRIESKINRQLNGLYSSIRPDITGSTSLTIRKWLSTQSYSKHKEFGINAFKNVSRGVCP